MWIQSIVVGGTRGALAQYMGWPMQTALSSSSSTPNRRNTSVGQQLGFTDRVTSVVFVSDDSSSKWWSLCQYLHENIPLFPSQFVVYSQACGIFKRYVLSVHQILLYNTTPTINTLNSREPEWKMWEKSLILPLSTHSLIKVFPFIYIFFSLSYRSRPVLAFCRSPPTQKTKITTKFHDDLEWWEPGRADVETRCMYKVPNGTLQYFASLKYN